MKELLAMGTLLVENEGCLGNPTEVMVEDILLQDQCVLPVALIIRGSHISDDVQELSQKLYSRMEILHLSVLLLILHAF